jgi:hypothetical protein
MGSDGVEGIHLVWGRVYWRGALINMAVNQNEKTLGRSRTRRKDTATE